MPTFILPMILCSFIDSMVKKRMFAKDLAKKKKQINNKRTQSLGFHVHPNEVGA
jgi:hypothetical protein